MEANSCQKNHAIFLPLPLQGHINPFTQLALKLASRGFTITFLLFQNIHQEMTQARPGSGDIFEEARAGPEPLDIRVRVVWDGLPLDFDRTGKLEEYLDWYVNGGMYNKFEEAVGEVVAGSNPKPNVFVADTFYPWASKIAKKFGLFHASFWTQPALIFNLYYHVHLLRQHGHFDCPDPRGDPIYYIPGVKSIEPKDLISYLQEDPSTNMHKLIFKAFDDVRFADCVLCNSIQDLEPDTILTLNTLMPFYPIGPIFRSKPNLNTIHTSLWSESNCINWLNQQPNGSILYVSFGSLANFTKDELMEFAYGLKLSNVGFVWVLRPRTVLHEVEGDDLLPQGFKEETSDRGIIVPWTDQLETLSHRAIVGFLTHCGWNSVLESIWNEVPMLCFPVFGDQPSNRKLVVDDWRIGANLCDGKSIKREDIAAKIRSFINHKVRDEFSRNIKEGRFWRVHWMLMDLL